MEVCIVLSPTYRGALPPIFPMTLHYSLFAFENPEGELNILDLSQIGYISQDAELGRFLVYLAGDGDPAPLPPKDTQAFLSAWNRYKYAAAAAQLINLPDQINPTIACNSALRVDKFIGFLAEQKIKELDQLAEEKTA